MTKIKRRQLAIFILGLFLIGGISLPVMATDQENTLPLDSQIIEPIGGASPPPLLEGEKEETPREKAKREIRERGKENMDNRPEEAKYALPFPEKPNPKAGKLWKELSQKEQQLQAESEASPESSSGKSEEHQYVGQDRDYILQPGDRMKIKIFPEDAFIKGGEMEISTEGNVTLSLAGKIKVSGMTIPEAERVIAQVIDADYLVNPEVVIELSNREKSSFSVLVLGQVKNPGTQIMTGEHFTLLQAISAAGGFSSIANPKKVKIMRKTGEKTSRVIRVNAEAILSGEEPDVELEPGDAVHVSESLF